MPPKSEMRSTQGGLTLSTVRADDPAMSLPSAPSTRRKGSRPLLFLLAAGRTDGGAGATYLTRGQRAARAA